jgi:hypothetical protein
MSDIVEVSLRGFVAAECSKSSTRPSGEGEAAENSASFSCAALAHALSEPVAQLNRFSAWPVVLMLVAGPSAAFAQPFACYPVQRGDTASGLAKRLTGDASNEYQPWFDIVDRSGRSVPKSQYQRVRSGWRACVVEKTVTDSPLTAARVVPAVHEARLVDASASRRPPASAPRTIHDLFLPGLVVAVFAPALGLLIIGGHLRRRNAARIFMRQFAYLFVREFQRPLLQNAAGPALRARLRVSSYQARLEICLAPGNGRRYPNLSDHRKNVEYDVDRVLAALADESFVRGRMRMRDGWVVVPFRFRARVKQRGVRCISSL